MALSPEKNLVAIGAAHAVWIATVPGLERVAEVNGIPSSCQSLHWHEQRGLTVAGGEPGETGYVGYVQLSASDRQELALPTIHAGEQTRSARGLALTRIPLVADDLFTSAQWSDDGSMIAVVSLDGSAWVAQSEVIDAEHSLTTTDHPAAVFRLTAKISLVGHSTGLTGAAWIGSRELATASLDSTIRTWRIPASLADTPQLANQRTLNQHAQPVLGLKCDFTNSQQPLLTSFSDDQTIRFWYPQNGRMLRFHRFNNDTASSCDWSSAKNQLYVGTRAGWLQQIDLATATVIRRQQVANDWITSIVCLPDASVLYGTGSGHVFHFHWSDN
jgi:WD40 repeat protein